MDDNRTYQGYDAFGTEVRRDVVELCTASIIIVDDQQTITAMNPAAEAMFGHGPGLMLGRSFQELVPEPLQAGHSDLVEASWREAHDGCYLAAVDASVEASATACALRADGTEFPVDISVMRSSDGGRPVLLAILRDRTEPSQREQSLAHLVDTQALPGALNRRAFVASAETMISAHLRRSSPLALAMIDIDDLKRVNHSHGHSAGDEVIHEVVARLASSFRNADLIGRWGGEEFVVLLEESDHRGTSIATERARRAVASEPINCASLDRPIAVTVSIGAIVTHEPPPELDPLLDGANHALSVAKRAGPNRCRLRLAPF